MDIPTAKQKLLAKKADLLDEVDTINTALSCLDTGTTLTFPNIDVIVQDNKDLTDRLSTSDMALNDLKSLAVKNNLDPITLLPVDNA